MLTQSYVVETPISEGYDLNLVALSDLTNINQYSGYNIPIPLLIKKDNGESVEYWIYGNEVEENSDENSAEQAYIITPKLTKLSPRDLSLYQTLEFQSNPKRLEEPDVPKALYADIKRVKGHQHIAEEEFWWRPKDSSGISLKESPVQFKADFSTVSFNPEDDDDEFREQIYSEPSQSNCLTSTFKMIWDGLSPLRNAVIGAGAGLFFIQPIAAGFPSNPYPTLKIFLQGGVPLIASATALSRLAAQFSYKGFSRGRNLWDSFIKGLMIAGFGSKMTFEIQTIIGEANNKEDGSGNVDTSNGLATVLICSWVILGLIGGAHIFIRRERERGALGIELNYYKLDKLIRALINEINAQYRIRQEELEKIKKERAEANSSSTSAAAARKSKEDIEIHDEVQSTIEDLLPQPAPIKSIEDAEAEIAKIRAILTEKDICDDEFDEKLSTLQYQAATTQHFPRAKVIEVVEEAQRKIEALLKEEQNGTLIHINIPDTLAHKLASFPSVPEIKEAVNAWRSEIAKIPCSRQPDMMAELAKITKAIQLAENESKRTTFLQKLRKFVEFRPVRSVLDFAEGTATYYLITRETQFMFVSDITAPVTSYVRYGLSLAGGITHAYVSREANPELSKGYRVYSDMLSGALTIAFIRFFQLFLTDKTNEENLGDNTENEQIAFWTILSMTILLAQLIGFRKQLLFSIKSLFANRDMLKRKSINEDGDERISLTPYNEDDDDEERISLISHKEKSKRGSSAAPAVELIFSGGNKVAKTTDENVTIAMESLSLNTEGKEKRECPLL